MQARAAARVWDEVLVSDEAWGLESVAEWQSVSCSVSLKLSGSQ